METDLARWRQGWPGTRRVVWASVPGAVVWPETRAVMEGGNLEIVQTLMRGAEGGVPPEAAAGEVVIATGLPLDADAFGSLSRARFVLRPSVGYDDVDVEAATRHGILVGNVPDTFVDEVADHTLTLILAASRRLPHMEHLVRGRPLGGGRGPASGVAPRPPAVDHDARAGRVREHRPPRGGAGPAVRLSRSWRAIPTWRRTRRRRWASTSCRSRSSWASPTSSRCTSS